MVYTRKSRRARLAEEEEVGQDAGAAAKKGASPAPEEESSYRRRRRYANRDAADDESAQAEAADERGESGSSDRSVCGLNTCGLICPLTMVWSSYVSSRVSRFFFFF